MYDENIQDITVVPRDIIDMHYNIDRTKDSKGKITIKGRTIRRLLSHFWLETDQGLFHHQDFDFLHLSYNNKIEIAERILKTTLLYFRNPDIEVKSETSHDGDGRFLMNTFLVPNVRLDVLSVRQMAQLVQVTACIYANMQEVCWQENITQKMVDGIFNETEQITL